MQRFRPGVRKGETVYVPHLSDRRTDDTFDVDRVLLVSDGDGDVQLGTPLLDAAHVSARVLGHVKGDKVTVFKKKRRKRYNVKRGHRQRYTQLRIEELSLDDKNEKKQNDDE